MFVEQLKVGHFGILASCMMWVIIPFFLAISAFTPYFSVEAGPAVPGTIIGFLPSQITGSPSVTTCGSRASTFDALHSCPACIFRHVVMLVFSS